MRVSDRRSRLRSATNQAHASLDEKITIAGFFDAPSSYTSYLIATWRARQPVEHALEEYGAVKLFALWPVRRIASALQSDIDDVSLVSPEGRAEPGHMFPIETQAQALGALYVLEGSALGASTLAKRAARLAMTPIFGARHLALQTAMPKAWSTFLSVLESSSLNTAQEVECVEAAIDTFAYFEMAYG